MKKILFREERQVLHIVRTEIEISDELYEEIIESDYSSGLIHEILETHEIINEEEDVIYELYETEDIDMEVL